MFKFFKNLYWLTYDILPDVCICSPGNNDNGNNGDNDQFKEFKVTD